MLLTTLTKERIFKDEVVVVLFDLMKVVHV
jgi:hypothetical protein